LFPTNEVNSLPGSYYMPNESLSAQLLPGVVSKTNHELAGGWLYFSPCIEGVLPFVSTKKQKTNNP
jgi:hypothetical protein